MSPLARQIALLFALLIVLAASAAPALLLAARASSYHVELGIPPQLTWEGKPASARLNALTGLDPARDALLIVAPSTAFSDDDVLAVATFAHAGGRALIAADTGAGADLVARLDAGVELTNVRVYSPDFREDPEHLLARSTGAIAHLDPQVTLDRPVLVDGGSAVLVPPPLAWADLNGNGLPDLEEPLATGSFAALAPLANGAIMVVGAPSAVLAGAPTQDALLSWLTDAGHRRLVVDESHRDLSDPLALGPLLGSTLGLAAGIGILILASGVAIFIVLAPRIRRKEERAVARLRASDVPSDLVGDLLGELSP